MRSSNIWRVWHWQSMAGSGQGMNAPQAHVRVRKHKAALPCTGHPAFLAFITPQNWWPTKEQWHNTQKWWCQRDWCAAGGVWHLLAVGSCVLWFMSPWWLITFRSFPFYHISENFPLLQTSFCSTSPRLQMASTHASPLFEACKNSTILWGNAHSWVANIQLSPETVAVGTLTFLFPCSLRNFIANDSCNSTIPKKVIKKENQKETHF